MYNCIYSTFRHPNKNLRPSFSDLHTSLSDHTLSLGIKEECHTVSERPDQPLPLPLHPQAHTIGAPLEAGKELYNDLQKTYINEWCGLNFQVNSFNTDTYII